MFGWLFKNAVADPQEQGATDWQTTPRTAEPPCNCRECQRARAAHLADLGLLPGIAARPRPDVTWATDPTVYESPGLLGRMADRGDFARGDGDAG